MKSSLLLAALACLHVPLIQVAGKPSQMHLLMHCSSLQVSVMVSNNILRATWIASGGSPAQFFMLAALPLYCVFAASPRVYCSYLCPILVRCNRNCYN